MGEEGGRMMAERLWSVTTGDWQVRQAREEGGIYA
jgi:hypothetical protein